MEAPVQSSPPQAQESSRTLMDFMKHNLRSVSIGGGLVVLVALVLVAYTNQQRRSSETASQMLGMSQSPKQLEELLTQYPSSSSAPIALLALATDRFTAGVYDQAFSFYERFIQQYPKHVMVPVAELGKVMCQEAQGEFEQALMGFGLFVAAYPDYFLLPQVLRGKAHCLQRLHRPAEARAVYEDFIVAHPDSEWKNQMEMSLRFMEREQRASSQSAVGNQQ